MAPKTIPYSIAQTVRNRAIEQGGDTVFSFEGKATTFVEFDKASNRTANGLVAKGIEKGDRIAYLGKNSPLHYDYIEYTYCLSKYPSI